MISEEFKIEYCKESNLTEKEFDEVFIVMKCNCEYPQCKGWSVVANEPEAMNNHRVMFGG